MPPRANFGSPDFAWSAMLSDARPANYFADFQCLPLPPLATDEFLKLPPLLPTTCRPDPPSTPMTSAETVRRRSKMRSEPTAAEPCIACAWAAWLGEAAMATAAPTRASAAAGAPHALMACAGRRASGAIAPPAASCAALKATVGGAGVSICAPLCRPLCPPPIALATP
eukprot:5129204-Pleurochrysis_carterae.AAC.2